MEVSDTLNPPERQFSRPKARHRPIVERAGAFFIASVTGAWKRSIAPSKLLTYIDCPAAYLRHVEGDLPVSAAPVAQATGDSRVSSAPVARVIGDVVHAQISSSRQERPSVAVAVRAATAAAPAAPSIPKQEVAKAVRTARAMVAVATKAERRQASRVLHTVREPKAFFHFDQETGTFWFVKPDKIQVIETDRGRFVSVDDTKTGSHRHRFAHLVPLMFGLVVQRSRAWEKFWGITFEGNIRTRLVYLRNSDGRQLGHPEYVVDTIKPAQSSKPAGSQLSQVQKERLAGIEGFIRDIDASWKRGHFQVKPGDHCTQKGAGIPCSAGCSEVVPML
jgi:PD-(D/E)XK nuclease superfamily